MSPQGRRTKPVLEGCDVGVHRIGSVDGQDGECIPGDGQGCHRKRDVYPVAGAAGQSEQKMDAAGKKANAGCDTQNDRDDSHLATSVPMSAPRHNPLAMPKALAPRPISWFPAR